MEHICYNCFGDSLDENGVCTQCGFDGAKNREKYPLALPLGSILFGRYIIGRVLGQGGFGITYLAQDFQTKGRVAIKEFFPDTMASRTSHTAVTPYTGERGENFAYGLNSFLEEAKTMAEFIGNPNITRVDSYFEENGTGYFVMEYLEGDSFLGYIQAHGGRISWEETMNVVLPVMNALAAMHEKGIIHRDVTPDNIYITQDGTVKLLDFGAARYSLGNVSRSLDVILKHGFAPYEQYSRRGKQGPFTDVYALGATIYYAITGVKPDDAIERRDEDNTPLPTTLGAKITDAQEAVVMRALAVMPNDRYQNIPQFRAALTAAQPAPEPKPEPPKPEPPKPEPELKPKKKLPKWLLPGMAAVLAAVALTAGIGIWVMKPAMDYKAAQERMDAGAYVEAAEAFEALGNYQDSAAKVQEANYKAYQKAQTLMDSEEYDQAAEAFSELGNYKDSSQKAEDAVHEKAYQKAQTLMDSEEYDQAAEAFTALGAYKDSAQKAEKAIQGKATREAYEEAQTLLDTGEYAKAIITLSGLDYKDSADMMQKAKEAYWVSQRASLSAGYRHTMGLRSDGTVVATKHTGDHDYGQCNVSRWTDIVAVAAGEYHTAGLRSDGTVVATGYNDDGRCNVRDWTDIVAVAAGYYHTVGLRSDGTVVATGRNGAGQCNVSGWKDIVAVAARGGHTVGLRSDGTVVATGSNNYGQCNVSGWTDIVAVAAGTWHTVGLRSDGTVVATGYNYRGQCNVSGWKDIVAVAAGGIHTVGLRSDGTLVVTGSNIAGQCDVSGWKDIVAVAAGQEHTVGLRSNSTVLAKGWNLFGQCKVTGWKDIRVP